MIKTYDHDATTGVCAHCGCPRSHHDALNDACLGQTHLYFRCSTGAPVGPHHTCLNCREPVSLHAPSTYDCPPPMRHIIAPYPATAYHPYSLPGGGCEHCGCTLGNHQLGPVAFCDWPHALHQGYVTHPGISAYANQQAASSATISNFVQRVFGGGGGGGSSGGAGGASGGNGTVTIILGGRTLTTRAQVTIQTGWIPVHERKCKKCKTQSLRKVQLPDTLITVAMCRYCSTQEEV